MVKLRLDIFAGRVPAGPVSAEVIWVIFDTCEYGIFKIWYTCFQSRNSLKNHIH